jgi:hypothetical protein
LLTENKPEVSLFDLSLCHEIVLRTDGKAPRFLKVGSIYRCDWLASGSGLGRDQALVGPTTGVEVLKFRPEKDSYIC